MRDSACLTMIPSLLKKGAIVNYYDPTGKKKELSKYKKVFYSKDIKSAVSYSDLIIIHTEWNEYKQLNFKKLVNKNNFKVYDMRNLYSVKKMKDSGLIYYSIGR